jgi:glycosyltransferase involved in cell wall biosynthesis
MAAGIREATGAIFAFTDDDAIPRPDWLERLLLHFGDPSVGGVGGRDVLQPQESFQWPLTNDVGRISAWGKVIGNHHVGTGPPRDVMVLKGVNMAFRREAFSLPSRLRGTGAQRHLEIGTCLLARRRGWRLVYDPAAIVDHYPGPRFDSDQRETPGAEAVRDAAYNLVFCLLALEPRLYWRRAAYGLALGNQATPGLARGAAAAVRGERDVLRRLVPSVQGQLQALGDVARGHRLGKPMTPAEMAPAGVGRSPGPLEITLVAHEVGPLGGMERQLAELIVGLVERGHWVSVIARRCILPRDTKVRWIRVPGPARPFPLAYLWFFLLGTWRVWRNRAGLLHTTGAIVWNQADVSTIHYCHHAANAKAGDTLRSTSGFLRTMNSRLTDHLSRLAERWIYRPGITRQLVGVSQGVVKEVGDHFPRMAGRIAAIPLGVDPHTFRPDPGARRRIRAAYGLAKSDFVALFVGGDWERKGLSVALKAVARTPGCRLLVVGSGDIDRYRAAARRLRADDMVHFAGPRRDTAAYYAAADVFVLPSLYETFSLVTFEAASSGLPLLVTKVSGVDEILTDGENGWFIPRDPEVISRRLAALKGAEEMRQAMGTRSREAVARYSWARMVNDYISLYRSLRTSDSKNRVWDPLPARVEQ